MKKISPVLSAVSLLAIQSSVAYAKFSQEERTGVSSMPAKLLEFKFVQDAADKAKGAVRDAVKARGEEILEAKAAQVGKLAQNKFRELLLKDSSVRIVNGNGEEVGLHIEKANSEVVRSLVRKLSRLDLDRSIPGVPTPIAKFVLNKVENYLLAYASEYFGDAVQAATYNAAILSLGKAWNVGSDQLQKYMQSSSSSVKPNEIKLDATGLEAHQVTALQGLLNHYSSKLKMAVNGMIEEAVVGAVSSVAKIAYESFEAKVESGVRFATLAPLMYEMPMLTPVTFVFDAHKPQKGSTFNQFVRWALGSERTEEKLVSVATANVGSLLSKVAPSWMVVKESDLDNVFGKHGTRDVEEGFAEIYQTEAPKSVNHLLSSFATKTKETLTDIHKAASDFSDLMGPDGISQEEYAEKYGNQDPTNPIPTLVNAGKAAAKTVKSWFGW